jgi:(p)ppGpp synthase/HD superfamily hydrolase
MTEGRLYSTRLDQALAYAASLHSTQVRKSTKIPYLSHLLAVCALVFEDGGDEDVAIAGLLHDAVEDQGGAATLTDIGLVFGSRVADCVASCTDSWELPKPPWRERKTAFLRRLMEASHDALTVTAADKLHNVRSTLEDHRSLGSQVWERFNAGPDDYFWYHREVLAILQTRLPSSRCVLQLRTALDELSGLHAAAIS